MSYSRKKMQNFAAEYCKDWNATAAAKRIGYAESSAARIGGRLLGRAETQFYIQQYSRENLAKTKTDAAYLLGRMRAMLDADIADLYELYVDAETGEQRQRFKRVQEWPLIWRQGLVRAVTNGVDGRPVSVRLVDRTKQIELIGKHVSVSAFADRHILEGSDGGPVTVIKRVILQDERAAKPALIEHDAQDIEPAELDDDATAEPSTAFAAPTAPRVGPPMDEA